jgi:hypothetical protein
MIPKHQQINVWMNMSETPENKKAHGGPSLMIPKHQQIDVWMNMSETPENKKARLRYDNVFKTAWTDEVHFIKHSRKGNKFVFCEFCRTDFSINYGGHSDVTTVIWILVINSENLDVGVI